MLPVSGAYVMGITNQSTYYTLFGDNRAKEFYTNTLYIHHQYMHIQKALHDLMGLG